MIISVIIITNLTMIIKVSEKKKKIFSQKFKELGKLVRQDEPSNQVNSALVGRY